MFCKSNLQPILFTSRPTYTMQFYQGLLRLTPALALTLGHLTSQAAANPRLCVFDIVGTAGDAYNMTKDYVVAMQRHGITIELKVYSNEAQAADDLRADLCDAMIATGVRVRPFNKLTGSIDSMGSTTIIRNGKVDMVGTYEVMRVLAQTFAATSPRVNQLMVSGPYEIGGILPIGAVYPMVSDRRINTLEALVGKRISVLDNDPAQSMLVKRIGGVPVLVNYNNGVPRFIAGDIDMLVAPTLAYKPLNIQKGIGANGGIGRFPIGMMTYQVVINRNKFPEGFGDKSRKYWLTQFDRIMQLIRASEAAIPDSIMVDLSPENALKYTLMLREARIDIAQQGIYDKTGLKIIKRIRCSVNPSDPECATRSEEEWR